MADKRKDNGSLEVSAEQLRSRIRENEEIITDLPAVEMEADSLSSVDRISRTSEPSDHSAAADSFWDLGKPKPKVYAKPDFKDHSLSVTDIAGSDDAVPKPAKTAEAEKIIPREEFIAKHGDTGRVVNTVSGPRSIPTSDYRRRTTVRKPAPAAVPKKRETDAAASLVQSYVPEGFLIDRIDVRSWESEVEFYGRFAADARQSHAASPVNPPDRTIELEPFFSYVPQYAHMTAKQVEYYRWIRENIRQGRTPECPIAYILLYIYEIINLPDVILPEEGVRLLTKIWLGYRTALPRLDSLLCEWFADYCMIHSRPLPDEILPILREIVPKAQFKEFYLNLSEANLAEIGRILIEVSSDYDFRSARYYAANRDAYEAHIPTAVSAALQDQFRRKAGIFTFDRTYKMTRDSYCGAIVSSGIKRRVDLEFRSFTRRADSRETVTSLVKYAENRLRQVIGIKAKLGTGNIAPEDAAVIDGYFAPLIPEKKQKRKGEDAYMPDDYMKNYESEDSGFDFSAALAIEQESWVNTSRLTGEELTGEELTDEELTNEALTAPAYEPDEEITVQGQITAEDAPEPEPELPDAPAAAAVTAPDDDGMVREGLKAALRGQFRAWCRETGLYEGEAADRINTVFLDEIGDVVLEDTGSGFTLIEDYREDVEQWL